MTEETMTEETPIGCAICGDASLGVAWTDTHGIAQCITCGCPYRMFHYDEETKKPVDKPPTLLLRGENFERAEKFHRDTGGRISAVGLGLSFPGGYDVATSADATRWNEWAKNNPPKES